LGFTESKLPQDWKESWYPFVAILHIVHYVYAFYALYTKYNETIIYIGSFINLILLGFLSWVDYTLFENGGVSAKISTDKGYGYIALIIINVIFMAVNTVVLLLYICNLKKTNNDFFSIFKRKNTNDFSIFKPTRYNEISRIDL